eukprot:m51a1_g2632 putative ybak proline--trna ligase associated domain protein (174) ;mRNA; r:572050-572571
MATSYERARAQLAEHHLEDRIKVLDCSTATVDLAAAALGVCAGRVAKTLTFRSKRSVNSTLIMLVAAGDARIDNERFKEEFGIRPRMLTAKEVEALTGLTVGGVCPFGVAGSGNVKVCLDASLRRFDHVYTACGSDNSAVCLTPDELEQASGSLKWVDVCSVPSCQSPPESSR